MRLVATQCLLATTLASLSFAPECFAWGRQSQDRVLLRDVTALTLYSGKMTKGRRSPPVPQTLCVDGEACQYYRPDVIQCKNAGFDGQNVQWKCEAEMEDYYRMGRITVSCEGYDSKRDDHILAGSCGVEYALHLTDKGRAHFSRREQQSFDPYRRSNKHYSQPQEPSATGAGGSWEWMVPFVLLLGIYVCIKSCCAKESSAMGQPPPYAETTHPPPYSETAGTETFVNQPSSSSSGFWTGMGIGGLAGYAAGSRQRNQQYERPSHRPYERQSTDSRNRSRSRASSGRSSPPVTQTSAGFGGTSMR